MYLDKGLRAAGLRTYSPGYQVPSTATVNREKGVLLCKYSSGAADAELATTPWALSLSAKIMAAPIVADSVVTCNYDGQALEPVALYALRSAGAHRTVSLLYQGLGSFQWHSGERPLPFAGNSFLGLQLALDDQVIYRKDFFLTETLSVQKNTLAEGSFSIEPPGEVDIYPLWAYGGFFQIGCGLEEIGQTVFTLIIKSQGQALRLEPAITPLGHWLGKTMVGRQRIRFMNTFAPTHRQSLGGDLEAGMARIEVIIGVDERGETCGQRYKSCRYSQPDPATGLTEIFFIKEENE